jgi:RNA polymerase sigma-70 factor (ECF subfamily)
MRDVAGYSAEEVCAALENSEGNERLLLHRARTKLRRALEQSSSTRSDPRVKADAQGRAAARRITRLSATIVYVS